MNKKLFIGIMAFFALLFLVFTIFFPHYNPIFFYIQHISLFIFIIMFLVYTLKLGYDSLSRRQILGVYLKWITLILFSGLLYLFSNVQLYYIQEFQTPTYYNSTYYDEYHNLVYISHKNSNDPVFEVIEQTQERFVFRVIEAFDDKYNWSTSSSSQGTEWINYKANILTDIEITYDDLGNILTQDSIETTFIETDYNGKSQYINSIKLSVENIFDLESDIKTFTSMQRLDTHYDSITSFDDVSDVSHQEDLEYEKQYYLHESTYNGNKLNLKYSEYSLEDKSDIDEKSEFEFDVSRKDETTFLDSEFLRISIAKDLITYTYQIYLYTESDIPYETTTYSSFNDMDYVFESSHHTLENSFDRGTDRKSFNFLNKVYLEHGDLYTIIEQTDYGLRLTKKSSGIERDSEYLPISSIKKYDYDYISFYYNTTPSIYNYNHKYFNSSGEYGEIILYRNPLIYTLIDFF